MKMNLMYHQEQHSGYGRFGHYVSRELFNLGVEQAGDIGLAPDQDLKQDSQTNLRRSGELELASVALWLSTPPHVRGWYEGQFATIFTMWESTEIPPGFRQNVHHFDRIFVPSIQNVELFSRFHPDVRYIPLGVDTEKWHYRPRPPVEREFRFLTAGYGPRKGASQVAAAFRRVFPRGEPLNGGPIPKLIVRSRDDVYGPGIERLSQDISGKEEVELYANAHCFVSGSKGEGWGLMPLQAITQGLPTILGDAHGHHAFAHWAIPLGTHPFECKGATFWGDGGYWWEPDFDEMCAAMRQVYEEYDKFEAHAKAAAPFVAAEFPWSKTAEAVLLELPEVFGPAPVEKVWKGAPPKLFHIRVNKQCQYRVNGVVYAFEPGVDYWEAADLKRAILASGHLDMETFDPHDIGVEDGADIDDLRARNSICPTCHQPYNRDHTIADLIGAV